MICLTVSKNNSCRITWFCSELQGVNQQLHCESRSAVLLTVAGAELVVVSNLSNLSSNLLICSYISPQTFSGCFFSISKFFSASKT